MQPDDRICYCYGVTLRKLVHFSRRTQPEHPSRMTECLGAGTGCGWCIPFLVKIAQDPDAFSLTKLTPEEYAEQRKSYIRTSPKNTFGEASETSPNPLIDGSGALNTIQPSMEGNESQGGPTGFRTLLP